MISGGPIRLHVCNTSGECVPVKTERPLVVSGLRLDIMEDDVSELVEAMNKAYDELNREGHKVWSDNFDLKKIRSR